MAVLFCSPQLSDFIQAYHAPQPSSFRFRPNAPHPVAVIIQVSPKRTSPRCRHHSGFAQTHLTPLPSSFRFRLNAPHPVAVIIQVSPKRTSLRCRHHSGFAQTHLTQQPSISGQCQILLRRQVLSPKRRLNAQRRRFFNRTRHAFQTLAYHFAPLSERCFRQPFHTLQNLPLH